MGLPGRYRTGYRACRPACRRAAQPEYAGAQVDEEPQASALLQAVLGDMWQAIVSNPLSQGISLREISGFLQAALPESALNQLDAS